VDEFVTLCDGPLPSPWMSFDPLAHFTRGGGRTLFFFVSVAVDGDSWKAGARGSARPTPSPTARSALAG
jgi:hypothetical protein